jgi:hypothetical protein
MYILGSLYLLYGKGISNKLVTSLESTPFFEFEDYRHLPENLIFTGTLREYTKIDIRDIGGFACCGASFLKIFQFIIISFSKLASGVTRC